MNILRCPRRRGVLIPGAVLALAAVAPAAASAAVTVTGDDGNPVVVAPGVVIRNMDAKVGLSSAPTDKNNYAVTVAGPDGVAASAPSCRSITSSPARSVEYRGSGTYTVTVVPHAPTDYACAKPAIGAPTSVSYVVDATVTVGAPPAKRVLIRKPNSFTRIPIPLPITLNPGALATEVQYARNAVLAPDGGISGPTETGYVDSATSTVPLSVRTPGTYTVVARQKGFSTASGTFFTPWSPAVQVVAVGPFDLESLRFPDARGPSYQLRGVVREKSAAGTKVGISLAKGLRGRYRSIGSARVNALGVFKKRFTTHQTGTYRIRITFRGNSRVAAGRVVQKIKISRRYFL